MNVPGTARLRIGAVRRPTVVALAFLAVSVAAFFVVRAVLNPTLIDFVVYRAEGSAVLHGHDLYGTLPVPHHLRATYPPFAAMLFTVVTVLPLAAMKLLVTIGNIALAAWLCWLACRLVDVPAERRLATVLWLTGLVIWAEPVYTTIRYGQIDLIITGLVVWDLTRPAGSRGRGVGIGLATAVKVTPGLFIVYLALTGRIRAALTAAATWAATVALSAAVLPSATWHYWTDLLFDTNRVGRIENAANQSWRGLAARIEHTRDISPWWTVLVAVTLIGGMACAVFAYRRCGDRWGAMACAMTSLLVAPIAWTHHWVWCVPIAVLLWFRCRRWAAVALVFWTDAVWAVPHAGGELRLAGWQIAVSSLYVTFGVFFLVLTAVVAHRAAKARTPAETPAVPTGGAQPVRTPT